jgi:UDP-hydrolysing UDP-N-acetyl-D-glucosamine 2-epimerase
MTIAMVLTARPSYAKYQPIIAALLERGQTVTVIACASALLERYGRCVDVARRDFPSVEILECWSTYEGENLVTSAKETGALLIELSGVLHRLQPDAVMVMADRHEVLAAAQAASYLHLPTFHCQGGEVSGSIDDRVRNSITALADYHFTATEQAKFRVVSLTGAYDRVFHVGCPSVDVAKRAQSEPPVSAEELGGAGAPIKFDGFMRLPLVIWLQHPVTSEAAQAEAQAHETAVALHMGCNDVIAMWPGEDAGSAGISKVLRRQQEYCHTVRNLPPNRFLKLLTQCSVLVGNSSAGIREASYLGVPVVNVGSRQHGRQRGPNVIDVPHDAGQIAKAIEQQIAHGPYASSGLYGRGDAGQQIAERLIDVCSRTDTGEKRQQGDTRQELPQVG